MSIVTERFMAAVADPAVVLPVLAGLIFGVALTLAVSEIADRMHRRAHARRMQQVARRTPVRPDIAWPESPTTRLVREADERKSA